MTAWLPLLIVCGAIALVLGPVLLLQPSQRQRRVIALRNHALTLGLRVHFMPLNGEQVTAYCLPWLSDKDDRSLWLLIRKNYAHELHFQQCWHWSGDATASESWCLRLKDVLAQLPEGVDAVGNGPQGLAFYWREKGDIARLEQLAVLLRRLAG